MGRITDLSQTVRHGMRGVHIAEASTIQNGGWNSTTLTLFSHATTHMDAPRHFLKDTGNTDIIHHNGKLLATWYMCGDVYQLDPLTLDARGKNDFGGKLKSKVSAHPKVDARTGELVWETLILDYRTGAKHSSGPIVANG